MEGVEPSLGADIPFAGLLRQRPELAECEQAHGYPDEVEDETLQGFRLAYHEQEADYQ